MAKKKLTIEDVLVPKDEISYEIPENWCWVKLEYVAECLDKFRKPINATERSKREGNIPYYGATGQVGWIDDYLLDDEVVLVGEDGAPFFDMLKNKAYIIYGKSWVNNHAHILKGRFKICTNKYLMYYLNIFNYHGYVNGTTRLKLTQKRMLEIPIALPPLAEQERIVNRIESLFEKVDKASELVEEAREGFEKRRAAILEKAFSGELTKSWREENGISDEWEKIKFKELGKLERGRSKHRPRNDERLFGGPYPFIQTGDIANSREYIYHHKQTLSEFGLEQSRLFPKGTLCITIAANIGDVAILTYDCCFPDSVVGFTPNDDVESKFILYYINLIKRDLEHYAPATAQKNINLAILGALDIPKPSIEEQREIVKLLDKTLDNESKVEDLIDLDNNIDIIKKSILAKAFRGELGSNDLDDESSIELLKVIL